MRQQNRHFSPKELGKLISEDVNNVISEGVIRFIKGPVTIKTRRGATIVANAVEDHGTYLSLAIGKPHQTRPGTMYKRRALAHPHLIKMTPWVQVPIMDMPPEYYAQHQYMDASKPRPKPIQRVKNGRPCTRGVCSLQYPYGALISIQKINVLSMENGGTPGERKNRFTDRPDPAGLDSVGPDVVGPDAMGPGPNQNGPEDIAGSIPDDMM